MADVDTRAGAYAVIVVDGQILLALWNEVDPPRWTLPGGGVEPGETTAMAAVREVAEETGFVVELETLLGEHTRLVPAADRFVDTDRDLHAIRSIYRAHIVGGELTRETDGTTDEARWIPLSDVGGLDRVDLVDVALELWRAGPSGAG
jgi:8-oxo-dGTP diphosphatase